MTYGLGVDLGTTFTAVAIGYRDRTEMVSLGNRSIVAPAVIFASRNGRLLTGDAADRRAVREPDRAAREFKRRLGDPTPVLLGDAPFSPVALLAATLNDAVESAIRVQGSPPEQIVLSRPAVWGPYRLEQFDEVPRLAGLDNVRLMTEPVAAATFYAARRNLSDGDVIAVYDLGGGTFDTAILRMEAGEARILGNPEGVEWLGGADFDEAILHHVDRELGGAVSEADPRDHDNAVALVRLRQECVLAKEALSADEETTIPVFLPGVRKDVQLTRAQFEDMVRPPIDSTVEALRRALSSADVEPEELSAVLLAGGSSRIPLVARMVEAAMHRPTVVDAHPKHVVALGAAQIAAEMLTPATFPPLAPPGTTATDPSGEISRSASGPPGFPDADRPDRVAAGPLDEAPETASHTGTHPTTEAAGAAAAATAAAAAAAAAAAEAAAAATGPRQVPDAGAESGEASAANSKAGRRASRRDAAGSRARGRGKGPAAGSEAGADEGGEAGEAGEAGEDGGREDEDRTKGAGDPGWKARLRHQPRILAGAAGVVMILAAVVTAVAVAAADNEDPGSAGLSTSTVALKRTPLSVHPPIPTRTPVSVLSSAPVTSAPASPVLTSAATPAPTASATPAPPASRRPAPAAVAPKPAPAVPKAAPASVAAPPAPAPPAPAPAARAPTSWNVVNVAHSMCLDSDGSGAAYAMGCNGGNYQRWQLVQVNGGYRLKNLATGRCLSATANIGADGTKYRGTVSTTTCDGRTSQIWAPSANSFGDQYKNAATHECLDSSGEAPVYTQDCNGGNFQHWNRK